MSTHLLTHVPPFTYLSDDLNSLSHQVCRIEPHTKLTNHGDVSTSLQLHVQQCIAIRQANYRHIHM